MRLILIRHAEPDYETDSLTEKGIREAAYLGERVKDWKIDELYVSCLGRARKTAEPIETVLHKKAIVLDWLQEFRGVIDEKYGTENGIPWDLKTSLWTEIPQLYEKDHWYQAELMAPVKGQPSVEGVYQETCEKLDALLAEYGYLREGNLYRVKAHSDATLVLVCHMAITFMMLSHLLGTAFSPLMQGCFLPPSSVTVVNTEELEKGIASFRCQGMGDTRHLARHGEPISEVGYFGEVFQL